MISSKFLKTSFFICLFLVVAFWVFGHGEGEAAPRFNTLRIAPEGAASPKDFTYPDLSGKPVRLSDYRGKVVLLSFFATWCPLCSEEMPKLIRLHERFRDRGFTVLAVSIDQVASSFVQKWVEQKKLNYPVLHDRSDTSRRTHNVRFVPTLYLFDRNLNLAAWAIGSVDWEGEKAAALIEGLLGGQPTAHRGPSVHRATESP